LGAAFGGLPFNVPASMLPARPLKNCVKLRINGIQFAGDTK
jgi:hypothetical protein